MKANTLVIFIILILIILIDNNFKRLLGLWKTGYKISINPFMKRHAYNNEFPCWTYDRFAFCCHQFSTRCRASPCLRFPCVEGGRGDNVDTILLIRQGSHIFRQKRPQSLPNSVSLSLSFCLSPLKCMASSFYACLKSG